MNLSVTPTSHLEGEVKAPASKSYTIRAVAAAMLAEGTSIINDPLFSEDTKACMLASQSLGAIIKRRENNLEINGVVGLPKKPSGTIDTLNSGTTIRLMTAIASLCQCKVTLTGDDSIRKRPIEPLLDALRQVGVKAVSTKGCPPVTVEGPPDGGLCTIRGDISSQFISALLMALPLAVKDSTINITGELKSRPYVDMTVDLLSQFKIIVRPQNHSQFIIPGDQMYKAAEYTVEGDYSSAAFILAAAALTESRVTVRNLFNGSRQADKKILTILQEMGASVSTSEDSVTVAGTGRLHGIKADLGNSPDLLPITAVLGSLAEGRTLIYNTAHARLKECDRIKAMAAELKKMGADIKENPDGLDITGGKLKGTLLDSWHDHRIVMSLAIAGLRAEGKTEIKDKEYVGVTFPGFVKAMTSLGAQME